MNLVTCPNGHNYNADFFQLCPFCRENDRDKGNLAEDGNSYFSSDRMNSGLSSNHEPVNSQLSSYYEPVNSQLSSYRESVNSFAQNTHPSYTASAPEDRTLVIGWLVCVFGPDRGKYFELHYGENTVGRGADMDIRVSDQAVSRNRQAVLFYDDRCRRVIARMGESRSLYYVNGKPVITEIVLENRARIRMGRSELIYVSLCGDDFSWS